MDSRITVSGLKFRRWRIGLILAAASAALWATTFRENSRAMV